MTIVKDAITADADLPTTDEVHARLRAGPSFTRIPLLAEWLETWLSSKKRLAEATAVSYKDTSATSYLGSAPSESTG